MSLRSSGLRLLLDVLDEFKRSGCDRPIYPGHWSELKAFKGVFMHIAGGSS